MSKHSIPTAPMISVISGKGGVGKSTLALLMADRAARAGLRVALVEGDLQFGNLGFWLNVDEDAPSLALGHFAQPVRVHDNLVLYKAPCFPEVAEQVSDEVAKLVPYIRANCDLVIADTGAFWSGLTAELSIGSDICMLVFDQRPTSLVGAVKASELCTRLNVPEARKVFVLNRWSSRKGAGEQDIRAALQVGRCICVQEGKDDVDYYVSMGDLPELYLSENPMVASVDLLLEELLQKVGLSYAATPSRGRKRARR